MNRRTFFGKSAALAAASSTLISSQFLSSCGTNIAETTRKPNIVIILLDDAGWKDVGYHGSEISTPNIDRLRDGGVELDRFYVNPTCSPTRASLLTGKPSSRSGIHSPVNYNQSHSLPAGTPTIANMLSDNGYETVISGKWHLGWVPEAVPNNYGFDRSYGYLHGWIDQYTHLTRDEIQTWHRDGTLFDEEGHATDLIADNAVDYIKNTRDVSKPFFLYTTFSVPHLPLQEENGYVDPYRSSDRPESRQFYAASMTHVDEAIGKIIGVLDEERIREKTVVLFFSDNGGTAPGEKNYLTPFPTINTTSDFTHIGNNLPLRGWKGQLYEGGIRVPAVISWPGTLAPEKTSGTIAVYDIFPTIANLIGADINAYPGTEGIDVWPAVTGGALPADRIMYIRTPQGMMVRKGGWKLIHIGRSPDDGTDELFDVADDPYEERDLADENPSKLAEMKAVLAAQFAKD